MCALRFNLMPQAKGKYFRYVRNKSNNKIRRPQYLVSMLFGYLRKGNEDKQSNSLFNSLKLLVKFKMHCNLHKSSLTSSSAPPTLSRSPYLETPPGTGGGS